MLDAFRTDRRRAIPQLERLETRVMPRVTIQFDYSLDAGGMFDNPAPRALLAAAARSVADYLETSLIPLSFNNQTYFEVIHPVTRQPVRRYNTTVPADTILVYIGGTDQGGSTLATAYTTNQAGCDHDNLCIEAARQPWLVRGNSLSFDTVGTSWHFGLTGEVPHDRHDFFSVAVHELGHILGIRSQPTWTDKLVGGTFRGPQAMQRYGGPVPARSDHFDTNVRDPQGQEAAMDPNIGPGVRKPFTYLDFAALADVGWTVTADPTRNPHRPNVLGPTAVNGQNQLVAGDFNGDGRDDLMFVFSPDGTNRLFFGRTDGTFDQADNRIAPGLVNNNAYNHVVVGDYNNDGRDDLLFRYDRDGDNRWFFGRPDGTFDRVDERIPQPGINGYFRHVVVADFNGDRRTDLMFHEPVTGQNRWFFARSDGGYDQTDDRIPRTSVNEGFTHVVTGDFNEDGRADLMFFNRGTGHTRWFNPRADGGFADGDDHLPRAAVAGYEHLVAGDFDRDGSVDLLFHQVGSGSNRWYYNRPGVPFEHRDQLAHPAAVDGIFDYLVAGDFDGNGAADAFFRSATLGENVLVPSARPRPTPPGAPANVRFNDTGVVADGITRETAVTLTGTVAGPGLTVRVLAGDTFLGSTTSGAGGAWSFTTGPLSPGPHDLHVVAINEAGQVSPTAAALRVVVDPGRPAAARVTPNTQRIIAAHAGKTFTLAVTFSEPMDPSRRPALAILGGNLRGTLSFAGGAWADARTYVARYRVADVNVALAGLTVQVSGAYDVAGNLQAAATFARAFQVDTVGPQVLAVRRLSPSPAPAGGVVRYLVTFSEAVAAISARAFRVATAGLTGAAVVRVSRVDARRYVVDVRTGRGAGLLRLDVPAGRVRDAAGNPLATSFSRGDVTRVGRP